MWIETSSEVYSAILRHHLNQLRPERVSQKLFRKEEWRFKNSDAPLIKVEELKNESGPIVVITKHFLYYHKNETE